MSLAPERQLAEVLVVKWGQLYKSRFPSTPDYYYKSWDSLPADIQDDWLTVARTAIEWKQEYASG